MVTNFSVKLTDNKNLAPVWVQCINPPLPPPETQLKLVWSGDPVEFLHNVSYQCQEEGLYFEAEREMEAVNVTCLTDGSWAEPAVWPRCIRCKTALLLLPPLTYFY